jgi:hypothetical protein
MRRAISAALEQSNAEREAARRHAAAWSMTRLVDSYLSIYERCQARR